MPYKKTANGATVQEQSKVYKQYSNVDIIEAAKLVTENKMTIYKAAKIKTRSNKSG